MGIKIDYSFIFSALVQELKVLPLTLTITIVPLMFGLGIGIIIAIIRLRKIPVVDRIAAFYVSFVRGTPLLLHIMLIYFALPMAFDALALHSKDIPIIVFIFVAFSINAGAYMSEIIRSGILSVNYGQVEAAYSVGMTAPQAMRRIVLPQALAVNLPMLCSMFIALLQGSSLAFSISIVEVTGEANIYAAASFKFLEAFIAAAIIYWGMTILVERITSILEKRVQRYNRGGVT
jgi:L-cystine transport system permease protein